MAWLETKWQTWTPVITQVGNVTFNTTYAKYAVLGTTVIVRASLSITGSGTSGNAIVISGMPAGLRPLQGGLLIGTGVIIDSGVAYYSGPLITVSATDWRVIAHNTANYVGASPSFGLASPDSIYINAIYEAN